MQTGNHLFQQHKQKEENLSSPLFYFRLNETPKPKLSLKPGFKL